MKNDSQAFPKNIKLYFIALLKYELFEELFLYKVPLIKLYKLIKVQFAYILDIIYILKVILVYLIF